MRVCVVGSANVDLTFRAPRLPRPGETLPARSLQTGFGGKGANQAVMAARLGAAVSMVARVGRDDFGAALLRNFHDHQIDTTFVTPAEGPSGAAAIVVDDAAENCILVVPGANAALSPEDVRRAEPLLCRSDVLLVQLEVPLETVAEALRLARAGGVRTVLNPAPAADLPDDLLRRCDWCVPNEGELARLARRAVDSLTDAESAARELRRRGASAVVVTLGERGALVVGDGPADHVPGFAVTAADTSGAGDAFCGTFGVMLAEGLPAREAARRANAAAAVSVTRAGTQASFPTRAEAAALWEGPD